MKLGAQPLHLLSQSNFRGSFSRRETGTASLNSKVRYLFFIGIYRGPIPPSLQKDHDEVNQGLPLVEKILFKGRRG